MSRIRTTPTYNLKKKAGVRVYDEYNHAVFIIGNKYMYNGNDSEGWDNPTGKPPDGLDNKKFDKYVRPLLAREWSLQSSDVGEGACFRLSNDLSVLYNKVFKKNKTAFDAYVLSVANAQVIHDYLLSL